MYNNTLNTGIAIMKAVRIEVFRQQTGISTFPGNQVEYSHYSVCIFKLLKIG